jgi:hypothetical protein
MVTPSSQIQGGECFVALHHKAHLHNAEQYLETDGDVRDPEVFILEDEYDFLMYDQAKEYIKWFESRIV